MKLIVTILTLCIALTSGTAMADLTKARAAINVGDYTAAYHELKPLAEQGDAKAQYSLAFLYDTGLGVDRDYEEAAKWYLKSAEQGVPNAQHNLGVIYAGGKEIPQDLVQAYFWFDVAAAAGWDTAVQNRNVTGSNMTAEQIAEAKRLTQEWFATRP